MRRDVMASRKGMAALLGAMAAAGGAGWMAGHASRPSDKAVAVAIEERMPEAEFRDVVASVLRARGHVAEAPPAAAAVQATGEAPHWWIALPPDAHLCPVTGQPGIPIGDFRDRASGYCHEHPQPWRASWMWASPADSRIRWAHWGGCAACPTDPLESAVLQIPGPGEPWYGVHYREWWLAGGTVAELVERPESGWGRPLTAAELGGQP